MTFSSFRKGHDMIQYRTIHADEINRALFQDFIRRQVVTDCWRREEGRWVVRSDPFTDDWSQEDYRTLIACLKNTARTGGLVYGAFREGSLKGFTSVEPELFGGELRYLDLSCIHVSEDMRGQGIGKTLFCAAMDWAGKRGARRLYISAHSAVESQAFYKAMGCVEAQMYHQKHVEAEPYDCQLECVLPTEGSPKSPLLRERVDAGQENGARQVRELADLSFDCQVRELTGEDASEILALSQGNPLFYQHCPPPATRESILADLRALPPGTAREDKYYLGFFREGKLIALMDLIFHYPDRKRAFIGLFMVEQACQGRGVGSRIIEETAGFLKRRSFEAVRLAYAGGNPQSRSFWRKNGFVETGEKTDKGDYVAVAMERRL